MDPEDPHQEVSCLDLEEPYHLDKHCQQPQSKRREREQAQSKQNVQCFPKIVIIPHSKTCARHFSLSRISQKEKQGSC